MSLRTSPHPRYLAAFMLSALLCLSSTLAMAGTISADLDHSEGAVGEPFVLTVTIEGARESEPTLPSVDGLEIRQQGVSESTSWVNGQRSAQLQLGLLVTAQHPGTFTIPSIKVKVDGQEAATVPLTLKIHDASATPNTPAAPAPGSGRSQGAQGGQGAQGQAQQGRAGGGKGPPKGGGKADTGGVFLERSCDNLEPYIGEQVICTVRLYHRGNLNGGQRVMPAAPDFRRFNIEGEKRYQKLVNGQPYVVLELKEIVVPTKSGALTLPPFTVQARILTFNRRNNPLDKFFDNFGGGVFNFDLNFTEEHEVTLESEPAAFHVKPLPEAGKPQNFSGLVGAFQLTAKVAQPQVAAGNTVTVTVTVEGDGLADSLGDIAPNLDKLGKVYPDKPEYTEQASAEHGIRSRRVYKYALVPARPGDYSLGKIELPTFNPKLQQYTTLTADLGRLVVTPGKAEEQPLMVGQSGAGAGGRKEDVKVLGADLIGPHRGVDVSRQHTITRSQVLILVTTGTLPVSAAFLALGFVTWRRRSSSDLAGRRRSQAYRHFKEALSQVQVQLAAGHVPQALTATYTALRAYLGDRYNRHGTALAGREVEELMLRLGLPSSEQPQLAKMINALEQVEFGGQVPALGTATELVNVLDQWLLSLEKQR